MACVVICWKIRIFAYWTTPSCRSWTACNPLWFAEKFVSLLIEQHPAVILCARRLCCDLLKNSYLCLLNNTGISTSSVHVSVVICWKIRIFAYWTTPSSISLATSLCCDLLKNSYLCLLNNTQELKDKVNKLLWFAEKFVSLLIEQHLDDGVEHPGNSCDLLKNSYLCLLNNTWTKRRRMSYEVVICWKIRIFAYWTTPLQQWLHQS